MIYIFNSDALDFETRVKLFIDNREEFVWKIDYNNLIEQKLSREYLSPFSLGERTFSFWEQNLTFNSSESFESDQVSENKTSVCIN